MNEKHKLLFQNLKEIKDYWVKTSKESLNPESDLIWSENENALITLQSKMTSPTEIEAFGKVQDEVIKGVFTQF